MIQTSFNLPTKYRLDLRLVKRRKNLDEKPLLPDLGKIGRARKGSKLSRFFKHIFEHKKIRKILGTNMALMLVASSFLPTQTSGSNLKEDTVIESNTPLTTERGAQYPVKTIKITQGYHFFHPALDLDGITGDRIYPIMAGKVEAVEYSKFAYGNAVLVRHGGITSLYAHLSKINVQTGDKVTNKTVIGEMGATGRSWGDHLHLEVRDHGIPISPFSVLPR